MSLILDGSNSTLTSPIDRIGEGGEGEGRRLEGVGSNPLIMGFEETTSSVLKLEFSGSHISKMVEGKFGSVAFSVEFLDLEEVFDEDTKSGEFFRGGVGFLMLSFPSGPEVMMIRIGLEGRCEANDNKK